jgi:signal transduction histidine kinase
VRLARAVTVGLIAVARLVDAQRPERPVRILLLFQQQAETQPMEELARRLRQTVQAQLSRPLEFYQEGLDFDRFGGPASVAPLVRYLDGKYRGMGIDAVVPVGSRALRFTIDRLSGTLPQVPIVFALCAEPLTDPATLPSNVTGRLALVSRFGPTIMMARALQPDAREIVILAGSGLEDSSAARSAVSAATERRDSLPVTVLQGLTLDELLRELRKVPRQSIVVLANYRIDPRGHAYDPLDIVGSLAHASAAPMYTQLLSYVGEGVVGGSVTDFEDEGEKTAQLVVRVLRRRSGDPLPPVERITNRFVVDWRQLHRWELPERALPAGTEVLFREQTALERYRSVVLVTLAVLAAEGLLIAMLLRERRRRQLAQQAREDEHHNAEVARRQVAHLGRVALVGELAATLSHELRQPLTAILVNAQSGLRLVQDDSPECVEAREIFESIAADDKRAVRLIEGVRNLLRKEDPATATVDLNQVCRDAVLLLRYDAAVRHTRLELKLSEEPVITLGVPVELQQVILNLLLNALDSVAASSGERKVVVVRTATLGSEVELEVTDSGPGISPSLRERLFESFVTTKPEGLGLGLAIVRSIVQRHGGRVQGETGPAGGAVFRVVLPVWDGSSVTSPIVAAPDTMPAADRGELAK